MFYVFNDSQTFYRITTTGNEFDTCVPIVELYFTDERPASKEYVGSFKDKFPDLNPTVVEDQYHKSHYHLEFKGNVLRAVIDILFKDKDISDDDRADIASRMRGFEYSMEKREKINDSMNNTQNESFQMIMSPIIEVIFEAIPDLPLALKVCGVGIQDYNFGNKGGPSLRIIEIIMTEEGTKGQFESVITEPKKRNGILEEVSNIWGICSGANNQSHTFLRIGTAFPDLTKIRNEVANIMFTMANDQLREKNHSPDAVRAVAEELIRSKNLDPELISKINYVKFHSEYEAPNAMLHQLHLMAQQRRLNGKQSDGAHNSKGLHLSK